TPGCSDPEALGRWVDETVRIGVNLHGAQLGASSDATTVRRRNGQLMVTDGPFAETKEQIAGYDVLECKDMDEALHWASQHPTTLSGSIEVRALMGDQAAAPLPPQGRERARYMMLVCLGEDFEMPELDATRMPEQLGTWLATTGAGRQRLFGDQLAGPDQARTVRKRQGEVLVTDGPFAETKEVIAGFDILECSDLDEAIEVAAAHPMAAVRSGGVLRGR
ncbi:MAG TPA: YciI family protein, partial [Acidimicrobiales bacterium]|nr:YciI family protein [Acidimicrobiales bacterium]